MGNKQQIKEILDKYWYDEFGVTLSGSETLATKIDALYQQKPSLIASGENLLLTPDEIKELFLSYDHDPVRLIWDTGT